MNSVEKRLPGEYPDSCWGRQNPEIGLTNLKSMLYYHYNKVINRIWFDSKRHQINIESIVELFSFWIGL